MNLLFIDANIYLGLYNTNKPEFKKLLSSLIELKNNIFISKQIVDEVNRNKLNIFRHSIDNYIKQSIILPTSLPEHLDDEASKSFSEWNKNRRSLESLIKESNKELHAILDVVLTGVSNSSDNISKKLNEVFSLAIYPTNDDLEKARYRREMGNPPGKIDDPLGDQLSWEILLSKLNAVSTLWIVSTDRDYFAEHKDSLYLNPVLTEDINTVNSNVEIKLFNKLSEALREYNKQAQIQSLPNTEELDKISESESASLKTEYSDFRIPSICPNCETKDCFNDGSFLRSQYGGLTLQYRCKKCSFVIDTGESFD